MGRKQLELTIESQFTASEASVVSKIEMRCIDRQFCFASVSLFFVFMFVCLFV